ncbi:MAG TPA: c-type cytochrome [Steroidobacteraceae bacterium]|nr:c-type cytochrome [Steroidobacteraceae bacterium]
MMRASILVSTATRGWLVGGIVFSGMLCACHRDSAPSPAEAARTAVRAATLRPADERLAALYDHSCRACHANAQASAPLTGDRAAWLSRLKKGNPELVQHVLTGFNGMPPGGQCFTCTTADFDALIAFMSN